MSFNFESMNNSYQRTMCKGVNTKKLGDIKNLKDYCGCVILVDGFFFSHSQKFNNDQVVIAGTVMAKNDNGEWVNCGMHLMNTPGRTYGEFKAMADDPEAMEDILLGKLAMTNIQMADTKSGSTVIYKYRTGVQRYELDDDEYMTADDEEDLPWT